MLKYEESIKMIKQYLNNTMMNLAIQQKTEQELDLLQQNIMDQNQYADNILIRMDVWQTETTVIHMLIGQEKT